MESFAAAGAVPAPHCGSVAPPVTDSKPPAFFDPAGRLDRLAAQLSSAVHGLNNALHVIAGNAELLEMTEGIPQAAALRARAIAAEAQRASGLLTEVLALSREVAVSGAHAPARSEAAHAQPSAPADDQDAHPRETGGG